MIDFRNALKPVLVAVAIAIGVAGFASAQTTGGDIAGSAAEGDTIVVKGNNGFTREIKVSRTGKYKVRHLPVGSYNVIRIDAGGNVVQTQATEVVVGRTSRLI